MLYFKKEKDVGFLSEIYSFFFSNIFIYLIHNIKIHYVLYLYTIWLSYTSLIIYGEKSINEAEMELIPNAITMLS